MTLKQKQLLFVSLLSLLVPLFPRPSRSESPEQKSRKGIFFSLIGFIGSDVAETRDLSVGGGARLGGGVTENFLIYAEAQGSLIPKALFHHLMFLDTELKGQYYVWRDWYVNFGAGVSSSLSTVRLLALDPFDVGFSMSAGTGYEFRLGKTFFASPEFRLGYKRIGGSHFLTPEVGGQLGWHF